MATLDSFKEGSEEEKRQIIDFWLPPIPHQFVHKLSTDRATA